MQKQLVRETLLQLSAGSSRALRGKGGGNANGGNEQSSNFHGDKTSTMQEE